MIDCNDPVKILLSMPYNYTVEMAFINNDILNTPTAKSINTGRLNLFIQNVNNGITDCVFITTFGIDGPAATSILKYDGRDITYITDNSRFSQIYGDIHYYKIKKLYTETTYFNNLIVTSYHVITSDNIDFVIYNDNVFIYVKRLY
jgi:hypothetical protein